MLSEIIGLRAITNNAAEHPIAAKLHNPCSKAISSLTAVVREGKVEMGESIFCIFAVRSNHVDNEGVRA